MSTVNVAALREAAEKADHAPLPSTDRILAWEAFQEIADPTTILALIERLEAAEGAVERARALADEWHGMPSKWADCHHLYWAADGLRAALDGGDQ